MNPSKDRQIQFWLPNKITSDDKFEKSPNQPTEDPFSWTKTQKDAKLEMIKDKNLLHFSNINFLDDIPAGHFSSSHEHDCSVEEFQEPVEIIQQSAADEQENECMNLENQSVISNDSISSVPTMSENGNGESSSSGILSRTTMQKHPKQLVMQCNFDTREIIFKRTENILPFEFKISKNYPKKFNNPQMSLGWITRSLTKHRLGEPRNFIFD